MSWETVDNKARIYSGPTALPKPLQYQGPVELNLDEMTASNFEKLVVALVEDDEGATVAYLYGIPGQKQNGIDVIARLSNGLYRSYQAKCYKKFTLPALRKAVEVWERGGRPYSSDKFVLVVACKARRTEVLDEIAEMIEAKSIEIDLWDKLTLSNKLRDRPSLVEKFFGTETARVFCPAFDSAPSAPESGRDGEVLTDAAVRGPLRTLELAKAASSAEGFASARKPEEAAALFRTLSEQLSAAGFAFHADFMRRRFVETSILAGHYEQAAASALEMYWSNAADFRDTSVLHRLNLRLNQHLDHLPKKLKAQLLVAYQVEDIFGVDASASARAVNALMDVDISQESLTASTVVLERAMARRENEFPDSLIDRIAHLVEAGPQSDGDREYWFRLAACIAEVSGNWDEFLDRVRVVLPRRYHSWALARRASSEALAGDPRQAERHILDAIEKSCSLGATTDAAEWQYTLRLARLWSGHIRLTGHDEHTMAQQLRESGAPSSLPGSANVVLRANRSLHSDKPSQALPLLEAWRLQSFVRADLSDRISATDAIGKLYLQNGEPLRAINEFIFSGNDKKIKAAARQVPEVPVSFEYGEAAWPTTGQMDSALIAAGAVGDLLPDADARTWLDAALSLIRSDYSHLLPSMGARPDIHAFALVRKFAPLLSRDEAVEVLAIVNPWLDRTESHSRHTDGDHVALLAALSQRTDEVVRAAVAAQLLAGVKASHEVCRDILSSEACVSFLQECVERDESTIDALDPTKHDEVLAICTVAPEQISSQIRTYVDDYARSVASRDSATASGSTLWGADADWSTLVRALSSEAAIQLAVTFVQCSKNVFEPMANRNSALAALGDIAHVLEEHEREVLRTHVSELLESEVEDHSVPGLLAAMSSPFGSFRFNDRLKGLRGGAFYAMVQLASDPEQYEEVQRFGLIAMARSDENDAVQIARSLTRVPVEHRTITVETLRHFSSEPGRSLLAVLWAEEQIDMQIGLELAHDPSAGVRRSLALALSGAGTESQCWALLRDDVRRSVRLRAEGITG